MKNCIVILSRGDIRTLTELKNSLTNLYKNYVEKFPCDVVIFHESDMPKKFIDLASVKFNNLKFKEVSLQPPLFLTEENLKFKDPTNLPTSYRSMCRFYAVDFFNYLSDYDYYMRLDVDSYLPSSIDFDIFKYLNDKKLKYGYVAEIIEHPPVVKGLAKYIQKYKEKFNIKDKFVDYLLDDKKEYNYRMIYNNFEVGSLDVYKEPGIKKFLEMLDKSGYIYEYRWGDAPIRTFMLSLFVDRNKIHRFTDIDYTHQAFTQKSGQIVCEYTKPEWIAQNDFIGQG